MLIGLAGRIGVGKTTIAKMLVAYDGYVIRSFAYPLKKALVALTGLPMEYFTDITLKETIIPVIGKSPRQLMQLFATDFIRDMVYEDFWVWKMEQVLRSMDSGVNVVLDDCRFNNETALVRRLGGTVVHLDRYHDPVTLHNTHKSEQRLTVMGGDIQVQSLDEDAVYTYQLMKEKLRDF